MSRLVEYVYLDRPRIDSYAEQLRSPLLREMEASYSAELALAGPKIGGRQTTIARELTTHEKVLCIADYVSRGQDQAFGYVAGSFLAVATEKLGNTLRLWLPTFPKQSPLVILLEGTPVSHSVPESVPYAMRGFSGYTWLQHMLRHYDYEELLTDTWAGNAYHSMAELLEHYGYDGTFAFFGTTVGDPRDLTAFYRVRRRVFSGSQEVVFGYPICIAGGRLPLSTWDSLSS